MFDWGRVCDIFFAYFTVGGRENNFKEDFIKYGVSS